MTTSFKIEPIPIPCQPVKQMCGLRSCALRLPVHYPPELRYILFGYCIGLWCIFIFSHLERQKRLEAHCKKYKGIIAQSDEEMGIVKDLEE